ncbi:hypothetical protein BDW74DRAFT_177244 [Aspergillus multicolor]|uniref:uncharacterized protein n=1 Tax=Aspergillus multicolor TaxID=41759 RepID=UPI003CCDFA07
MYRTNPTAICEDLDERGQQTWGFFIYRTCYDDNAQWDEFMERMKGFAQRGLSARREGQTDDPGLLERLEWHVQQDPTLEGCSKAEIWRRHRALMDPHYDGYEPGNVQHCFPRIVDQEALDSVLDGTAPSNWKFADCKTSSAHVIVLDMNWFNEEQHRGRDFAEPDDGAEYGWAKVLVAKAYPYLTRCLAVGSGMPCMLGH